MAGAEAGVKVGAEVVEVVSIGWKSSLKCLRAAENDRSTRNRANNLKCAVFIQSKNKKLCDIVELNFLVVRFHSRSLQQTTPALETSSRWRTEPRIQVTNLRQRKYLASLSKRKE